MNETAPDLSVAIIACDAERTITRTLSSVAGVARRVVVVDSGSTDRTVEICREHGAEVVQREWEGYARQKQYAMEFCDSEWVLSLDADESLDAEAEEEVSRCVKSNDPAVAAYAVNRRVWFRDRELRHTWQPEWITRVVRRGKGRWEGYEPHPALIVNGEVRRIGGNIRHHAFATISEFVQRQVGHGLDTAESYYKMGRTGSPLKLLVSPPTAILQQLLRKTSWRDGWIGWVAAFGAGIQAAVKHMRLLELSRRST